jgi:hypothetical protein
METPTPFDLNEAIRRWQQDLGKSSAFQADNLEELASHLRASVQKLKAEGLAEEEAFLTATQRIGERGPLAREFAKVKPAVTWSWPGFFFCVVAVIFLQRLISDWEDVKDTIEWNWPKFHSFFDWIFDWMGGYGAAAIVVMGLALLLCWRLISGRWKGFPAFLVARCEVLARTKPIRTALILWVFAFIPFISQCILIPLNPANLTPLAFSIDWFRLAIYAAINVIIVVAMVLLARRGLRKDCATARRGDKRG